MGVMELRYEVAVARLSPTVDVWRSREYMPKSKHDIREFEFSRNGEQYICKLDISRCASTVEEYRRTNNTVTKCRFSEVKDLYFDNGSLVVKTWNSPKTIQTV